MLSILKHLHISFKSLLPTDTIFNTATMPDLRPNPKQRDIPKDAAMEGAHETPEEISNQARGHKANLSNPSQ